MAQAIDDGAKNGGRAGGELEPGRVAAGSIAVRRKRTRLEMGKGQHRAVLCESPSFAARRAQQVRGRRISPRTG